MKKTAELLLEIRDIIRTLRGPDGCPWDRKQTPEKVKEYLTEELYELLEAIDIDQPGPLAEETGDLLFMILFLVNLYEEKRMFLLADALEASKRKMVHRHPHVFGSVSVDSAEEVMQNWQKLKEKEGKKPKKSFLDGIPTNLPALSRAYFLTKRAAKADFDWQEPGQVLQKVKEEIAELEEALALDNKQKAAEETGDLLFSLVNLSRHLNIEPEQALRRTNEKFMRRFLRIEEVLQQQGKTLEEATLEEMDAIWEEAKRQDP